MRKKITILTAALALLAMLAVPTGGWGQTRTETTIWSEDFSSYSDGSVPTGGTYSYSCTNGDGTDPGVTKIYTQNLAGGTSPELLIGKKGTNGTHGGSFTAVVPLNNFEGTLTLTYYQNKQTLSVSSTTPGVSGGQSVKPSEVGQQTTTFTGITTSMTSITIVFQGTTTSNVRLDNIVLTGTQVPVYSITPVSNNDSYGSVSISGTTITATPESGYRVMAGDDGYTVISGTATVTNNGDNTFSVAATSDCTVRINFEPLPAYTVTLGDDNSTLTETSGGAGVTLPERTDNNGIYTFAGWSEANILAETTDAPSTIISAGLYHPSQNITLYPLFNRTESGVEWHLVTDLRTVEEGVYAVLTNDNKKAFNGSLSNNNGGHGQTTTGEFSFTEGVASVAPEGTCEITMIPVETSGSVVGFKMYNAEKGYLYAIKASSGNLHWKEAEDSYWKKPTGNSTNWIYSNDAYLRSYNNTSFRTYSSPSNGDPLHMAKKVSNVTVYYVSTLPHDYTVNYDWNGVETMVTQTNNPVFSLDAPNNSTVPTGFTFVGWTMYETDLDVTDILEGETVDLSQYNTDNASLYAVFSSETTARFIRVFQDETAADYVFILGPSIIPSGSYLDMGEYEILSEDAELFIIEDGAQLISSSEDVYATVLKNISQHGATTTDGGWNFIASPINSNSLDPATTGLGMITDNLGNGASETTATYDLYKFVENPTDNGKEWKNYRNATFNLANGQGYLYASKEGTTLNFTGSINPCNQNVEVNLDFTTGAEFAGWNLVGNPFTFNAYVNRSYYKMNGDGSAILADVQASGTTIAPCMGIMVHVGQTGQSVTFSKEPIVNAPSNGNVSIAVVQVNERGASATTVDKAIVSFNEGSELPKFYFGNPNASLYIPQGEKEYAIATSEGQGEMPLNFRANADGQYTLTVNPEGVEMNYLHLVDNMTGNDVDLLATPSYSFNATTRDYESRFRLVFAANNENGASAGSTTFAFYSNGNWMVNNEGEATLQVIDVMGRVLSNQTISGTAELGLNQQPGVYVLRLVNGNDVKTQKIVVR